MRPARELEKMVAGIPAVFGADCPVDLLALDDAEAAWFAARLKGRHGVKHVGVKRGRPGDELSLAERIDRSLPLPTLAPAPAPAWDSEGY